MKKYILPALLLLAVSTYAATVSVAMKLIRKTVLGNPIVITLDEDGEPEMTIVLEKQFLLRSDGLVGWEDAPVVKPKKEKPRKYVPRQYGGRR